MAIERTVEELVEKCGGIGEVAYHCGVHHETVRRWFKHGIPGKHWRVLMVINPLVTPIALHNANCKTESYAKKEN